MSACHAKVTKILGKHILQYTEQNRILMKKDINELCYTESHWVNGFHWSFTELKLKVHVFQKRLIHLYFISNKMDRICKDKSNYWSYSIEKGGLQNFTKFTREHLRQIQLY